MKSSIVRVWWVLPLGALLAGCFPPMIGDDDSYDPYACDYEPDLTVDSFTFDDVDTDGGTALDFLDITLCNWGGGTAEAGYDYEVWLSQSPDVSGENIVVYESAEMVGVAPWDCVSVDPFVAVGGAAPEGYYYVIVYVDYYDAVWECDESNNWSISDDAIYIVPGA